MSLITRLVNLSPKILETNQAVSLVNGVWHKMQSWGWVRKSSHTIICLFDLLFTEQPSMAIILTDVHIRLLRWFWNRLFGGHFHIIMYISQPPQSTTCFTYLKFHIQVMASVGIQYITWIKLFSWESVQFYNKCSKDYYTSWNI
jgi:hypothetical protein